MTNIYLTDRSLLDIEDIRSYSVQEWGVNTADKYLDAIQNALLLIQENPNILITKPKISNRFKAYQTKSHWLICDVIGEDIYILTIKHVSINLIERLKSMEPTLEEEAKVLYKRLKNK